jgi:hypothetical protein
MYERLVAKSLANEAAGIAALEEKRRARAVLAELGAADAAAEQRPATEHP